MRHTFNASIGNSIGGTFFSRSIGIVRFFYVIACNRSNLDPFEWHTDQDLWNALEKCCLKSTVSMFVNLVKV